VVVIPAKAGTTKAGTTKAGQEGNEDRGHKLS